MQAEGVIRNGRYLIVDGESFLYHSGGCGEAIYVWDVDMTDPPITVVPLEPGWEDVAATVIRARRRLAEAA